MAGSYVVSGSLSPNVTGVYVETGTWNGYPVYSFYVAPSWWRLFYNTGYQSWMIRKNVQTGTDYWKRTGTGPSPIVGMYLPYGVVQGVAYVDEPTVGIRAVGRAARAGINVLSEIASALAAQGSGSFAAIAGQVEVAGAIVAQGPGSVALGEVLVGAAFCAIRAAGREPSAAIVAWTEVPFGTIEAVGPGAQAQLAAGVFVTAAIAAVGKGAGAAAAISAGLRYQVEMRGLFRIFNEAEYWLFRSNTGPPAEDDSPFATAASLPATPADTYADGTWYLSLQWFNGVLASGFLPVGPHGEPYLRLDVSGGAEIGFPPIGPIDWRLEARAAGVVRLHAVIYTDGTDAMPGQWAIAWTADGSPPAEDDPSITVDLETAGLQVLEYELAGQAHETVVKIRLQTRRNDGTQESPSWVYSDDSEVLTITADAQGPSVPLAAQTWPGGLPSEP